MVGFERDELTSGIEQSQHTRRLAVTGNRIERSSAYLEDDIGPRR
jgi:hypothetical protein